MRSIKNYCLYYLPKGGNSVNDVLMIDFSDNVLINKREAKDKIVYMYHDNDVISLAILEFSHLAKIKINGTIFLPNSFLIKIINDYLTQNNIDIVLEEKEESGFVVGKILSHEEKNKSYLYQVDTKEEIVNIESSYPIDDNLLVCVAKVDTYLLPNRKINEYKTKDGIVIRGRICTYDDLQIEVSNSYLPLIMQEDELEIGSDFFVTEEKGHD